MSNSFKPGALVRHAGKLHMEFPATDSGGRFLEASKNELHAWVSVEPGQIGLCIGRINDAWNVVLFGEEFVRMLNIDIEAV